MRTRFWTSLILLGAAGCAQAQWTKHPTPGAPRTRDGKVNLTAPAPRVNGKPDLSGIWEAEPAPVEFLMQMLPGGLNGLGEDPPSKYFLNVLADFKPEEAPILPAAAAVFQKHAQGMGKDMPATRCLPAGVPASDLVPIPFKLVQTPGLILTLNELDTSFRQIFTDGRKHPVDQQPSWNGYSVGHWEGDTMVVETVGFNDQSWLDAFGHTHSDAMRVTERFRRRDFGHMDLQITIEDPKTFTKPITYKVTELLVPDTELLESFCAENEKDVRHLAASK